MKAIRIRQTAILLLSLIAFVWTANSILIPLASESILSSRLQTTFSEQSAIFTPLIASLGISGGPIHYFNCSDQQLQRWRTVARCQAYQNYHWSFNTISEAAKRSYPANAAKFDKLLRENGWVNDRPQDKITTLAGSNPDSPENGGIGGQVAFHKNIGHGRNFISCNLQVDVQGYQGRVASDPAWTLNMNEFTCSQYIYFISFNLHDYQYHGD